MIALALALSASSQATSASIAGDYQAVTETEYAIELKLEPSGQAQFAFRSWEAGSSMPGSTENLHGTWSRSGSDVVIKLTSGASATFKPIACLSYQEFGRPGCAPGLKLVRTTLAARYELQRFGLWQSDSLEIRP